MHGLGVWVYVCACVYVCSWCIYVCMYLVYICVCVSVYIPLLSGRYSTCPPSLLTLLHPSRVLIPQLLYCTVLYSIISFVFLPYPAYPPPVLGMGVGAWDLRNEKLGFRVLVFFCRLGFIFLLLSWVSGSCAISVFWFLYSCSYLCNLGSSCHFVLYRLGSFPRLGPFLQSCFFRCLASFAVSGFCFSVLLLFCFFLLLSYFVNHLRFLCISGFVSFYYLRFRILLLSYFLFRLFLGFSFSCYLGFGPFAILVAVL
jgi:hypothetical protein